MPHESINTKIGVKLNTYQDLLLRGTSALSIYIDVLLTSREKKTASDYKSIISQLIDSAALLGHANREIFFDKALAMILSRPALELCSQGSFYSGMIYPKNYSS